MRERQRQPSTRPHHSEQLLAWGIAGANSDASSDNNDDAVSLSSSAPVLEGAHNCGSSEMQELSQRDSETPIAVACDLWVARHCRTAIYSFFSNSTDLQRQFLSSLPPCHPGVLLSVVKVLVDGQHLLAMGIPLGSMVQPQEAEKQHLDHFLAHH